MGNFFEGTSKLIWSKFLSLTLNLFLALMELVIQIREKILNEIVKNKLISLENAHIVLRKKSKNHQKRVKNYFLSHCSRRELVPFH